MFLIFGIIVNVTDQLLLTLAPVSAETCKIVREKPQNVRNHFCWKTHPEIFEVLEINRPSAGSWIIVHGSWLKARASSLMAHGQEHLAPWPGVWLTNVQFVLSHVPGTLRHEPSGMSHEP